MNNLNALKYFLGTWMLCKHYAFVFDYYLLVVIIKLSEIDEIKPYTQTLWGINPSLK